MGCVVSRTFQPFYSGKISPLAIVQEEDLTADLEEKNVLPLPGNGLRFVGSLVTV